jgi:hypothetical protein
MYKAVLLSPVFFLLADISLSSQQIHRDYLDCSSADIYFAQGFAHGEVGLAGDQALLAWHVRDGSRNGIRLGGVTAAAAGRAVVVVSRTESHNEYL